MPNIYKQRSRARRALLMPLVLLGSVLPVVETEAQALTAAAPPSVVEGTIAYGPEFIGDHAMYVECSSRAAVVSAGKTASELISDTSPALNEENDYAWMKVGLQANGHLGDLSREVTQAMVITVPDSCTIERRFLNGFVTIARID